MCGRKGGRPFGLARRFPMAGIMFSHTIRTPGLPAIVKPAGLRPVRADIKRIRKMRRKTKRTGFFVWSICAILCAVLTASLFLGTALPMASQPEEPVSQAEPESAAPPAASSETPPAPSSEAPPPSSAAPPPPSSAAPPPPSSTAPPPSSAPAVQSQAPVSTAAPSRAEVSSTASEASSSASAETSSGKRAAVPLRPAGRAAGLNCRASAR